MVPVFRFRVILLAAFSLHFCANVQSQNLVFRKTGNISITGIFDSHDCSVETERDLQEMASAIWVVEALNHYHYLPGIEIGLSLFKSSCQEINTKKALIGQDFDLEAVDIGILTTSEIHGKLESEVQNRRTVHVTHIIDTDMLVDLTVQLLTNLQWMIVDAIVTDSENVLNSFSEKTSDEGICVRDELLINSNFSFPQIETKDSSVIVVIAAFVNISTLPEGFYNQTDTLIFVPTDFTFGNYQKTHRLMDLPENSLVLLPSIENKKKLQEFVTKSKYQKEFFNHKEPTKSPLFIGVALGILKLLKPLKRLQDEHCESINFNSQEPCAEIVNFIYGLREKKTVLPFEKPTKISFDDIQNTLQGLKIDPSSNEEMFLYITTVPKANVSEDFAIFQIFSLKSKEFHPTLLMINDNLLYNSQELNESGMKLEQTSVPGPTKAEQLFEQKEDSQISVIKLLQRLAMGNLKNETDEPNRQPKNMTFEKCDFENNSTEIYHLCENFVKNPTKTSRENNTMENHSLVVWRFSTWVSVNTSVGFMGVMCTLSIMFFIISRICKGDILEGSPYFTLLLMVGVIFVFFSSLIFHFYLPTNNYLVCNLRTNGPPLVYAIVFSLLLSRSLMLASSESGGGFVSHINGHLQSVLCLFMFGIQISLGIQFWMFDKNIHSWDCFEIHEKYNIIIALSYDFLLLAILVCVSPFIIRSKRNYKEGLLFSISIFFIVIVWSAWISLYFLLPVDKKDAAVALGLNLTGTVLLICIFIPRTYLMAAAIVRDKTARTLPSLDQNILSEVSDTNYKSNQVLNDSLFGTITYKSCEMGCSNPNFFLSKTNESCREIANDVLNRESGLDAPSNSSNAEV